jgi:hypothetical protein
MWLENHNKEIKFKHLKTITETKCLGILVLHKLHAYTLTADTPLNQPYY